MRAFDPLSARRMRYCPVKADQLAQAMKSLPKANRHSVANNRERKHKVSDLCAVDFSKRYQPKGA